MILMIVIGVVVCVWPCGDCCDGVHVYICTYIHTYIHIQQRKRTYVDELRGQVAPVTPMDVGAPDELALAVLAPPADALGPLFVGVVCFCWFGGKGISKVEFHVDRSGVSLSVCICGVSIEVKRVYIWIHSVQVNIVSSLDQRARTMAGKGRPNERKCSHSF